MLECSPGVYKSECGVMLKGQLRTSCSLRLQLHNASSSLSARNVLQRPPPRDHRSCGPPQPEARPQALCRRLYDPRELFKPTAAHDCPGSQVSPIPLLSLAILTRREALEVAAFAKQYITTNGASDPVFKLYFGDQPAAYPTAMGAYDGLINSNKEGVIFRCDDPDNVSNPTPSPLPLSSILALVRLNDRTASSQAGAGTGAARMPPLRR